MKMILGVFHIRQLFPILLTVSWLTCKKAAISLRECPSAMARRMKSFLRSRVRGDFAPRMEFSRFRVE